MIVGTAGHIDHGKTSLVKALTGVDCDRLKEEKARGITLDLGYAYADDGRLGFVDVPGHERLVHNMLKMVVLDEADRMLDMGFRDDIQLILDATPKERQTLFPFANGRNGPEDLEPVTATVAKPTAFMNGFIVPVTVRMHRPNRRPTTNSISALPGRDSSTRIRSRSSGERSSHGSPRRPRRPPP